MESLFSLSFRCQIQERKQTFANKLKQVDKRNNNIGNKCDISQNNHNGNQGVRIQNQGSREE